MTHLTGSFMATTTQSSTSAGTVLTAMHSFTGRNADELSLEKGDKVEIIERDNEFADGWFFGRHLSNGKAGLFPEVYTAPIFSEPPGRDNNVHPKQTTKAESTRSPGMDLLIQELEQYRTTWEAEMVPPHLQSRKQGSMSPKDAAEPDHFGATYRALIADLVGSMADFNIEPESHKAPGSISSTAQDTLRPPPLGRIAQKVDPAKRLPALPGAEVKQRLQSHRDRSEGKALVETSMNECQPSRRRLFSDSRLTSANIRQLDALHPLLRPGRL